VPVSSEESGKGLHIKLRPSRWLALALLFVHGGALGLLPAVVLPPWVALVLACAVLGSMMHSLNTYALLRSKRSVVHVIWEEEGHWTLLQGDGTAHAAELSPAAYVHPQVVILNFRSEGGRRSVIMLRDSVDPTTLRRLRARLATLRR
jgi:hypothetical protein